MKDIILIAPPAAGKGTQAKLLEEKYSIPHISTGDLLRDAINIDSEIADEITKKISKGEFVNDEIVLDLLIKRLEMSDCDDGYILDGFPRNLKQAELYNNYLKSKNKDLGIAILINLDKKIGKQRISTRLSCPNCGRIYNLNDEKLQPKEENKCDLCNSLLIKRSDDNAEVYENRFNKYIIDTEPIINYYRNKGILKIVDGNQDKNIIHQQLIEIIKISNR